MHDMQAFIQFYAAVLFEPTVPKILWKFLQKHFISNLPKNYFKVF